MQFSTLFSLSVCALGVFSAPVVEKRQSSAAAGALDSLFSQITPYTGSINSTASSINADSTAADNSTAQSTFASDITSISDAINSAIPSIQALPSETGSTESTNEVAAAYAQIFEEINGALNNIDATGLGMLECVTIQNGQIDTNGQIESLLTKRQTIIITPLTTSLSQLITALQAVVDNLLAVVKELLDGILTGINNALLGITL